MSASGGTQSTELRLKEHQQRKAAPEERFPAQLEIFHSDGMRKSADHQTHSNENSDDCIEL
jgi:hypothetical protein